MLLATVTVSVIVSSLVGVACLIFPWLRYDFDYIKRLIRVVAYLRFYARRKITFIDVFERMAASRPSKVFLRYNDESYTYGEMQRRISKVANMAVTLGLKRGDVVAIFMYNEPAYLWTWMGLATIGVHVAFLNNNLRSKSLLHCFSVCDAKLVVVGQDDDLITAVHEVSKDIESKGVKVMSWANQKKISPDSAMESLVTPYDEASDRKFDRTAIRKTTDVRLDTICYIYTSGTTGLPKAAVLTHLKFLKGILLLTALTDVSGDDVLYTALPLYHSAAGCIALGNAVFHGMTLVLKRKFSATQFFDDCRKYDVTIIQYIGELCRYLMARPPSLDDRNHKVRIALGNGLRRDIWAKFQERFGIHRIGELYAATEANGGLINVHNRVGVVGRASPLLNLFFPVYLVKYDVQAEQPVRNSDGLCIVCGPGEPGLLVMKIFHGFEFDGYKGNKELSDKKLLRNVLKKGDCFFNSGDLLVRDEDYFMYFNDRIGDTFRWKGENVSTQEVANVVSSLSWVEDCNVYGVEIPGQDGRAGMAAVTLKGAFEPLTDEQRRQCFAHIADLLPLYAVPRFVRLLKNMIVTDNLKQRKVELLADGFDPVKAKGDPLYCLNLDKKCYEPMTDTVYQDVLNGKVKF